MPGGLVAACVVSGEADTVLHQVSRILAVPGARLVGPIPEELQSYTSYAGAFLRDLAGEDAGRVLIQTGMEPFTQ